MTKQYNLDVLEYDWSQIKPCHMPDMFYGFLQMARTERALISLIVDFLRDFQDHVDVKVIGPPSDENHEFYSIMREVVKWLDMLKSHASIACPDMALCVRDFRVDCKFLMNLSLPCVTLIRDNEHELLEMLMYDPRDAVKQLGITGNAMMVTLRNKSDNNRYLVYEKTDTPHPLLRAVEEADNAWFNMSNDTAFALYDEDSAMLLFAVAPKQYVVYSLSEVAQYNNQQRRG
jgi:hypothetical protein